MNPSYPFQYQIVPKDNENINNYYDYNYNINSNNSNNYKFNDNQNYYPNNNYSNNNCYHNNSNSNNNNYHSNNSNFDHNINNNTINHYNSNCKSMDYNSNTIMNRNIESKYSPLNDPVKNIYKIMPQHKIRSTKKIFYSINTGNNIECPDYLKLPNLPYNQYSVDHQPRHKVCKKIFLNQIDKNYNSLLTENDKASTKEDKPINLRQISESREYVPDLKYIRERDRFLQKYNKKYDVRNFDIISNNHYLPLQNVPVPDNKFFANFYKVANQYPNHRYKPRDLSSYSKRYKYYNEKFGQ